MNKQLVVWKRYLFQEQMSTKFILGWESDFMSEGRCKKRCVFQGVKHFLKVVINDMLFGTASGTYVDV